jgi:predicted ferric reductase
VKTVTGWLTIETIAVTVPIFMAWNVGTGEPTTLWSNLLVITGSQAATTLVVAVLFASRFKAITSTIGIDAAIGIHRVLGSAAVLFIFIHLFAVVADYPFNAWLIDIFQAPARAVAGTSALIILLLMVFFANEEKQQYEMWRWVHRASALAVFAFIAWHIIGLDQLINSVPWLILFSTLAVSVLALIVSRWVRARRHPRFLVSNIYPESATASTVCLRPLTHSFEFSAGQFAWVRLTKSPWSEDHPFTICSSEYDPIVRITFRHLGDWTQGPMAELRPGRIVRLDGPHGAMSLQHIPQDRSLALIAVGVGMTPVMSILRTLADEEDTRNIAVFVSPQEDLFTVELMELRKRLLNMEIYPIVNRPITRTSFRQSIEEPSEWFYLVCGPPSMVIDCKAALMDLFVPESRILTEQFEII